MVLRRRRLFHGAAGPGRHDRQRLSRVWNRSGAILGNAAQPGRRILALQAAGRLAPLLLRADPADVVPRNFRSNPTASWRGLSPQVGFTRPAAILYAQLGQARVTVPSTSFFATKSKRDVDARQRRQVYAVCASLTALPGMTNSDSRAGRLHAFRFEHLGAGRTRERVEQHLGGGALLRIGAEPGGIDRVVLNLRR